MPIKTPPKPTLVLLVRHGQTPTTGRPAGRGQGLHLADEGQRPGRARWLTASPARTGRRGVRLAARAHPRDGGADRQGPRAAGATSTAACSSATSATGPARELKELVKLPEWEHRAALPERLPVPRRRVVHRDAGPHHRRDRRAGRRAPRRDHRGRVPRRPDQGGGRRRARHPPRPVPADRRLALLGHRRSCYGGGGPVVLAVNSTGDDLSPARSRPDQRPFRRPVVLDRSASTTSTSSRPAPSASPAAGSSTSRPARTVTIVILELREAAGRGLASYLDGCSPTCPRAEPRPFEPIVARAGRRRMGSSAASPSAYDDDDRPHRHCQECRDAAERRRGRSASTRTRGPGRAASGRLTRRPEDGGVAHRGHAGAGRRRVAAVPAVRAPDGPRRPHLPAVERPSRAMTYPEPASSTC